jgi:hypothetical protein
VLAAMFLTSCATKLHIRAGSRDAGTASIPDRFRTGIDERCPRPAYLVGVACAGTLADAQRQAAAMIAEQVQATVRSETASRVDEKTRLHEGSRVEELRVQGRSDIRVRATLDVGGLVRVVNTTTVGGESCALACLSCDEAARQHRAELAKAHAEMQRLAGDARDLLGQGDVLAAVQMMGRLREQYDKQRQLALAIQAFAADDPPTDVDADVQALESELRARRGSLCATVAVTVRTGQDRTVLADRLRQAIEAAAVDGLSRRGIRTKTPADLTLNIDLALQSEVFSLEPLTITHLGGWLSLVASDSGKVIRAASISPGATRASRPTLEAAALRSAELAGDELDPLLTEWLGPE